MSEYIEKDVNIVPYLKKLLSRWKFLLLCAFIGAVFGYALSKTLPKEYSVVTKISPELSYRSSSITSLAALAGVSTNMLNNTDALLPTVYPDIVSSPSFLLSLFDTPVTSAKVDTTLYVYLTDYYRTPWWSAVLSLPFKAVAGIKGLFNPDADAEENEEVIDPFHLTKKQASAVKLLKKNIETLVDKRTYLITITVKMQDPVVAAQLSARVMENLKAFISNYRTDKAKEDLTYFQQLYDEAEADYYTAQSKYSRYLDSHQGFVLQSVKSEQQRLQNDMNLKFQLYNSLAQQLQSAKAKVQQETPVFAEIVTPTVPLKKSKPKTLTMVAGFFLLGILAGAAIVISSKRKEK